MELTIFIVVALLLYDYISCKRCGLIYKTGDAIGFNKLLLDVKVKISEIQTVNIVLNESDTMGYYMVTTYRGMVFKTAKTKVGSNKYNHAGKLFMKCGIQKFDVIHK